MPIPKPDKNEDEKKFMSRCMSDKNMMEYKGDQRSAICMKSFKANGEDISLQINSHMHEAQKVNFSLPIKEEIFDGKKYLVVPVVLMTEGVHNGIFYSAEELSKYPQAWNGIPVPVQHPNDGGGSVSANSPAILEKTIGRLFNVNFNEGKLKGEIWLDIEKTLKLSPDLLTKINSKQQIDVSTGLWGDTILEVGEWNGEAYNQVLINYRPDHLAVLPGAEGACSWKDGCGIRANVEELKKKVDYIEILQKKEVNIEKEKEGEKVTDKFNSNNINNGGKIMPTEQRIKDVAAILANVKMPFVAEQKEFLEGMADGHFAKVLELNERIKTCKSCNGIPEEPKPAPKNAEEFIANAPAEIQEVLRDGLRIQREEKESCIKTIKANKKNKFTDAQLNAKSLDELETIVALIEVESSIPNYTGQGGTPVANTGADGRRTDGKGIPKVPVMEWSKK